MGRGKNLSKAGLGGDEISRPLLMDGEGEEKLWSKAKGLMLDYLDSRNNTVFSYCS